MACGHFATVDQSHRSLLTKPVIRRSLRTCELQLDGPHASTWLGRVTIQRFPCKTHLTNQWCETSLNNYIQAVVCFQRIFENKNAKMVFSSDDNACVKFNRMQLKWTLHVYPREHKSVVFVRKCFCGTLEAHTKSPENNHIDDVGVVFRRWVLNEHKSNCSQQFNKVRFDSLFGTNSKSPSNKAEKETLSNPKSESLASPLCLSDLGCCLQTKTAIKFSCEVKHCSVTRVLTPPGHAKPS